MRHVTRRKTFDLRRPIGEKQRKESENIENNEQRMVTGLAWIDGERVG